MTRTLTIALSLLLAIGVGCSNPTKDKTEAIVSEPAILVESAGDTADSDAAAPIEGVVYAFTENSSLDFEGYKVTGPHTGGFGAFEGTVIVPGEDLEQIHINVSIDATALYSDDPVLTKTLKGEDFFEVDKYPTASFISSKIEKTAEGYDVTGNLTMHGVTKGVTFPAAIALSGDTLTTEAEFTINRLDWGLVYKGLADDLIRDDVLIFFEVEATVQPSE